MRRRQYLSGIGGGVGCSMLVGRTLAQSTSLTGKRLTGVVYDPVTAEGSGSADGKLLYGKSSVHGEIRIEGEGFRIPASAVTVNPEKKASEWEYTAQEPIENGFRELRVHGKDGVVSGRLLKRLADGSDQDRSFLLERVDQHITTEAGIKRDLRTELQAEQEISPDTKIAERSTSQSRLTPSISCSGTDCAGYVNGAADDDGWYTAGVHGLDNHPDYDVPYYALNSEYGNRFHLQSFFGYDKNDQCCQNIKRSDYVDYRIERKDPEIEFENWFPTDEFTEESENWAPSFSIGVGITGTPLSVGVGSIRPTEKKGTVLARSRDYVDWHMNLSNFWTSEIPYKQKNSDGVQVDIKPMSADESTKEVGISSQYGYDRERQNGGYWNKKTQKIEYGTFVNVV